MKSRAAGPLARNLKKPPKRNGSKRIPSRDGEQIRPALTQGRHSKQALAFFLGSVGLEVSYVPSSGCRASRCSEGLWRLT
jgi:hypothetical protein